MAVSFVKVWSDAAAGAMLIGPINERRLYACSGDLFVGAGQVDAPGVLIYWAGDGTDTAAGTLANTSYPPCVAVQTVGSRDLGTVNQYGRYGPIQDPADLHMSSDLYFWKLSKGSNVWKTTVYLAGLTADGYYDASGSGRSFVAYCLCGGP